MKHSKLVLMLLGLAVLFCASSYALITIKGLFPSQPPVARPFVEVTSTTITATWGTGTNDATVVYQAENITSGISSSWGLITTWEDTGLTPETEYAYQVRASDDNLVRMTEWTSLGTKKTLPRGFKSNGAVLINGNIIPTQPNLEFKITSSSLTMSTCIIKIDGTAVTDGTAGGGKYDSVATSTGYTTISYAPKTALTVGTHTISIDVNDTDGTLYTQEITGLKVLGTVLQMEKDPLCYPTPYNPAAGTMKISYSLSQDSAMIIYIFDMYGNLVSKKSYASGVEGAHSSYNEIDWDGKNDFLEIAKNGVYMIVAASGNNKVLGKTKFVVLSR